MDEDTTTRRVRGIVRGMVEEAYGLPGHLRPENQDHPDDEPCLDCAHALGAHHGPDGEQRCSEDGCSCKAGRYASRSHYSADDDLVGTDDHNRRIG